MSPPAPVGIADLGGGSGAEAGDFSTLSFLANASIGDISAFNGTLGSDAHLVSLQLNAYLGFIHGGTQFVYWVQDVAELDTKARALSFLDNVWNATSVGLAAGSLQGNGSITGNGSAVYYGYAPPCSVPGGCLNLSDPGYLEMELSSSLGSSGQPTVRFEFNDQGTMVAFDTVSFPWATATTGFQGFTVNSGLLSPSSCPRCVGDAEWVIGGPGFGFGTTLDGPTAVGLTLDWWNGYNYQSLPQASDYGRSTAETLGRAAVGLQPGSYGQPEAYISWGNESLGTLWSPSDVSIVEVSVRTGTNGGSLVLGDESVPFQSDFVEAVVLPGSQNLSLVSGLTTYPLGNVTLAPGEALTLEVGAPPLVFVEVGLPGGTVWSVTISGQTLNGTGNLTFGETPGTYTYSVGSVSGYTSDPNGGNVTVPPNGSSVRVVWKSQPSGLLPEIETVLLHWAWAIVLVVLAVVSVVLVRSAVGRYRSHRSGRRSPLSSPSGPPGVCPHCGGAIRPGAFECPECGWRVTHPPTDPPPT